MKNKKNCVFKENKKENDVQISSKTSKTVIARSKTGIITVNSHEMCAERRLLNKAKSIMSKKKVPYTTRELKKCLGGQIEIDRYLSDGRSGISEPCIGCTMCLCKIDLKLIFQDHCGTKKCMRSNELNHTNKALTLADAKRWNKIIPSNVST